MKPLAMMLVLPFAAFAARTTVISSPEVSDFADAEAVTNITLVVDHSRLDSMRFVVELDGSATNGVEVALGADSNQDGVLSQEESTNEPPRMAPMGGGVGLANLSSQLQTPCVHHEIGRAVSHYI